MRRFRFVSIVLVLASVHSSLIAQSCNCSDDPLYTSYFEAGSRLGNQFNLANGNLFIPVAQTDYQLLFTSLRGSFSEPKGLEGNLGLAYRQINDCGWVLGAYAFYDRLESQYDNYFSQATIGAEMMNEVWDFRANLYLPDLEGKRAPGVAGLQVFNNALVFRNPQEFAYHGTDAEIGCLLDSTADRSVELRGFASGFFFGRDRRELKDIAGGRARLELRMYDIDWLGPGSRVVLGAEYQYDRVRGDVGGALLSVRVPLGATPRRRMTCLQRRMLNPIVREANIVTNVGAGTEAALNALTNAPLNNVLVVDGTTADVPGTVLANSGSTIIFQGDNGAINVNQPIVAQANQTLIGGGFAVVGERTGQTATFGTAATVNGTNAAQDVFTVSDGSTIQNMIITGGASGIAGSNATGFTLANNTISGSSSHGIEFTGSNSGDIIGNTVSSSGTNGIRVSTFTGGSIANNNVTGSSAVGISLSTLSNGTISGNTSNGNTTHGLAITTINGGSITGNTTNGNTVRGFSIGTFNAGTISGNTATLNNSNGFQITTFNGGLFSTNTSTQNTANGIIIPTWTAGDITSNLSDNNGTDGFDLGGTSWSGGNLTNNTSTNNGGDGFLVGTRTGGTSTGNTASGNSGSNTTPP